MPRGAPAAGGPPPGQLGVSEPLPRARRNDRAAPELSNLSVNKTGATRTKSVDGTRTIAPLAAARAAHLIRESPTLRVKAAWPSECFRLSANDVPQRKTVGRYIAKRNVLYG